MSVFVVWLVTIRNLMGADFMSFIFFYQPFITYHEIEEHIEHSALRHFPQDRYCFDKVDGTDRNTFKVILLNEPTSMLPEQINTAIVANRFQGIWCIDLLTRELTLCPESVELLGGKSGSGDGFNLFLEFFSKRNDRSLVARYIRESVLHNKSWSVTLSLPSRQFGKRKRIQLTGRSEVDDGVCVRVAGTVAEK